MDMPQMVKGDPNRAKWQGLIFIAIPQQDAGVTKNSSACDKCAFKHTCCSNIQCCPADGRTDMTGVVFISEKKLASANAR